MRSVGFSAHFADVFAVPAPRNTPKEELRARALPAIHSRLADVLDGVPRAGFRFTLDIESADHSRTASGSQMAREVCIGVVSM